MGTDSVKSALPIGLPNAKCQAEQTLSDPGYGESEKTE